jgi:hypothetical protein
MYCRHGKDCTANIKQDMSIFVTVTTANPGQETFKNISNNHDRHNCELRCSLDATDND